MAYLLNGGPDCAGPNPLSQALKTTAFDASLQRDTQQPIAGPSQGLRSMNATPDARAEEEQFYRSGAFDMGAMRQGLPPQDFQSAFRPSPSLPQEHPWMQEFRHQTPPGARSDVTLAAGSGPIYASQPPYTSSMPGMSNMGMYRRPFMSSGFATPAHLPQQTYEGKGKQKEESGRFVELQDDKAWDEAFSKMIQPEAEQEQDPILGPEVDEDPLAANLDAEWRRMQSDLRSYTDMDKDMAEWEAQYGSQFVNPNADFTFHQPDRFDYDALVQNPPEWEFQEENAFKDHPDAFEEGKRLLAAGAPFIEVEQAFEAACQKDAGRAEAWAALGETLAADEKEALAIRALEKAVTLSASQDAESAWLVSLLAFFIEWSKTSPQSLAISYINEGLDAKALGVLEEWLKRTYPAMARAAPPPKEQVSEDGTFNPWANQQRIIDMYLAAARAGPAARTGTSTAVAEQIDADVQIGLGVLFYGNSDYNLAKDCFEAALSVKPEDYILWNRLGATLANSGHPEDAISAYRTALSIRPNFTRSLYNLGVSCLNINCFQEAAEHLLAALELQGNAGKGDESDGLWSTLRRTFVCMERPDLAEKARNHVPLEQFKAEFQF